MALALAPASERQVDYLRSLLATRVMDAAQRDDLLARIADGTLDKTRASRAIDLLRVAPKIVAAPKPAADLEVGMYRKGGEIYRIHRSRESGRLYAKRLVLDLLAKREASFVYDRGAIMLLTAEDRMSLSEAKAFGVETGICCVCGAFLTDPKSVAEGIGPVCAKRF